jgi:hypothetical protein
VNSKKIQLRPLTKQDLKLFASFRVDKKLRDEAGLYRVDNQNARAVGFWFDPAQDLSGVVFPYLDLAKREFNARVRRDNPERDANGKEVAKYLSKPSGTQRGLYWSPGARKLYAEHPTWEIVLVESEKAALAGTAWQRRGNHPYIFVAMGGSHAWKDSETGVVPDLVTLGARNVGILLDRNVATNPSVQLAEMELAGHLASMHTKVVCHRIPPQLDGVNGPDDFLAKKKDADFLQLLKAKPAEPWLDMVGESYEAYLKAPEPTFLIKDFLQTGGATFIGGLSGDGKTYLMLSMVQSLLTRAKLFGYFDVPQKVERVLYMTPEITLGSFRKRAEKFGLNPFVENRKLIVRTLTAFPQITLIDPAMLLSARDAVVFLDPAVRFMDGDENSNSDNKFGLAQHLFQLVRAGALAIVAAHHSPKDFENQSFMTLQNCLRGAGDIGGMLTSAWGIYQLDRETREKTICYIANLKPRDFEPPPGFQIIGRPHIDNGKGFQMHMPPERCGSLQESKAEYTARGGGGRPRSPEKTERAQWMLEWVQTGKTEPKEIAQLLTAKGLKAPALSTIKKEIDGARRRAKEKL